MASRLYAPYLCVVPAYNKKAKPEELNMDEEKLKAMSAMKPLAKAKIVISALSAQPEKLDAYMEEWANKGILNKTEFVEACAFRDEVLSAAKAEEEAAMDEICGTEQPKRRTRRRKPEGTEDDTVV